jgi:hypothetical protein
MHLQPAKLLFGALLATSVGALALPAHATSFSPSIPRAVDSHYVVVAGGVGDKAQGKINEMHDMGSGAANAVEEKHEEHEAAEAMPHHHSLRHKAKSKMNEVKSEAKGAADAVEDAHERHESAEHE